MGLRVFCLWLWLRLSLRLWRWRWRGERARACVWCIGSSRHPRPDSAQMCESDTGDGYGGAVKMGGGGVWECLGSGRTEGRLALSNGRFVLIINGLGLAHQPWCVPGAASGQAVLTYFQRGGGGHSPACRAGKASAVLWLSRGNMQTRLLAGLSVPLQGGGGAAPASIQTRQCFRLECLCQLTGGKSSAIHHNGSPPASQNVQHSFFFWI